MADHSGTPSPISSAQDSYRPNFDSHESLGYQRTRRKTYSLANSVSGPDQQTDAQLEEAPDSAGFTSASGMDASGLSAGRMDATGSMDMSGVNMSSDPASNTAADMSMTSIALADNDDRTRSANTTRILQRALDSTPKLDTGLDAFSDFPPRGIRHADYNKYVDELPDDLSAYTQVLIWCLARRIDHLRKAPPERLRVSLLLVNVLQNLQHKLQARLVAPSPAYREPLRLKPKMANPTNEWYSVVKDRLNAAYYRIHETTRESYNIAGEFEQLGAAENKELAVPAIDEASSSLRPLQDSLAQSSTKARDSLARLLQNVASLDGLTLEVREKIYETVELRERLHILESEDPIAVLRASEFQEEY